MNSSFPEEASDNVSVERVVCLPKKSNWAGVWMLLFLAALTYLMLFIPRDAGVAPFTPRERLGVFGGLSLIAVPCIIGAGWVAWWMQRAAIIADSEKICWRGVRKMHAARWEDVSDFHFTRVKSSTKYNVQTSSGRLQFGGVWTNEADLAALIAERASACGTTQWGIRGARPNDAWPRHFRYSTKENRWMMPGLMALTLIYPAAILMGKNTGLSGLSRGFNDIKVLYGWPMAALLTITVLAACLMMPIMYGALLFPMWRDARRRSTESIEATPEGLRWTNGTRRIECGWDEVRAFYSRPGTEKHFAQSIHVVETAQGDFDFTIGIGGRELLKRTVEAQAVNAEVADWSIGQNEAAERPIEHNGARIYHYRTPTNRAFLWFAGALAAMPMFGVFILNWTNAPIEEFEPRPLPWPATIVGVIVFSCLWWRYRKAAIRIDEMGIAQSKFNGARFMAWDKVDKYFRTPESWLINVEGHDANGQKSRVQFWISVGDVEALRREIEMRAINSGNRSWDDKTLSAPRKARMNRGEDFEDGAAPKVL